jgi:multidrug efflux system membrane fusion protein
MNTLIDKILQGSPRPSAKKAPGTRRRGGRSAAVLAVLALAVGLVRPAPLAAQSGKGKGGRVMAAVPVTGAAAKTEDVPVYLSGLGTVTPLKTVTVRTRVDGELIKANFREGQSVREGDLLAEIDPRPFQVQRQQAEGQLAKDQAALANAKLDLKRYESLIGEDAIPRQTLDTQATLVNQYEAAVKSDEAQVDSAELNLTYSRITAPITGIVGLRLVDAGNMVHASDSGGLVVITQQQPIAAVFTVAARNLPQILVQTRKGNEMAVEAWDQDLKVKLAEGKVLALDNQVDAATNTIKIKAVFPNQDKALYPNQLINAKLVVDTLRAAVVVPSAAIQRGPQTTYVFVVKPDQTVEIRNVEVRLSQGEQTVVGGLTAGEVVVIEGLDKLQGGTRVSLAGANNVEAGK